ncbi:hypothetical protein AV530_016735 [Patagioenas fasciata monilis]|uniref:Uncharacterized protein n=1 Tax=Patagioenas fasciata monilis TaxID=372326 RepID=A0A1V4J411_PATFA|nr:hypothetical protein AV530_016735 [Patagioenas fasciata monilis]
MPAPGTSNPGKRKTFRSALRGCRRACPHPPRGVPLPLRGGLGSREEPRHQAALTTPALMLNRRRGWNSITSFKRRNMPCNSHQLGSVAALGTVGLHHDSH